MTDGPRIYVDEELFLGRVDEQDRFRDALRAVQRESKVVEKVKDWFAEKEPAALPFIFGSLGIAVMPPICGGHEMR